MPAPTLRMDGGAVRLYRSSAGAVRDAGPYAADGWGCRAAAGASPRPTGSERMGPSGGFRRVPAAGHTGPALRDHTNPLPAGLRGLWPSYRNNAKHGLRTLPHFFQPTAPNHYKQLKLPKLKSFTRFFSCEGCPPPVCLRCSPGLFRHGGGAASCHTSSMAAKPHLALTKNSSPTTLANGRRATQIVGSRGQRPRSRRARREIPPAVAVGETPAGYFRSK